jgi:hypothetical protein
MFPDILNFEISEEIDLDLEGLTIDTSITSYPEVEKMQAKFKKMAESTRLTSDDLKIICY